MSVEDDEDIEYEPGPAVVDLDGDEQGADAATFASACAQLRRYTSQPYLMEAGALFGRMADAFLDWPQARQRLGAQTLDEWSAAVREQREAFDRGLALLDAGYTAAAYAAIALAVDDALEPTDPRDERHFSLRFVAEEIGAALTETAARLGPMADRICTTLAAGWAYPMLPQDEPAQDDATDHPGPGENLDIASGRLVPKTGLWVPTTIRYGCPNFLIAGQAAPPMTRACTRYDYAATHGGGGEPPKPAWSAYDYAQEPTVWRLVWYDTRYRAGARPGAN